MNDQILTAFYSELEKLGGLEGVTKILRKKIPLSGWSAGAEELAATRGMRGLEAGESLATKAPQRDIGQLIRAREKDLVAETAARAGKSDTEVMKAIRAGALDPKVHSIDEFRRSGNLVMRPGAGTAPSAKVEAPTAILRGPSKPKPRRRAVSPPPGALSRIGARFRNMSPRTRMTLGLGGAGSAGFGAAEMVD